MSRSDLANRLRRAGGAIALRAADAIALRAADAIALRAACRRRSSNSHPAPTFVFMDLVGYTALTEQYGDCAAARVARAFRRAVSALSREHQAVHVKSMGDGAMLWAPDATRALELAARAVSELGTRPDLLPVRVGVHTGPAILDRGDWYGGAVNLASRLAQIAQPNEALVTQATRSAVNGNQASRLRARREIDVRGLARQVTVWRVAATTPVRSGKIESLSAASGGRELGAALRAGEVPVAPVLEGSVS